MGTKASQEYETVVPATSRSSEKARRHCQAAEKHFRQGKLEKAEAELQTALLADVSYGPAHNNLGKIYFEQGKFYLAAWEFEYAIRVMPNLPEPHNNLGLIHERAGKLEEALPYFETAYRLGPGSPEFLGNLIRCKLALNEKDPTVKPLMEELFLIETRPAWKKWNNEQLGLRKLPDTREYFDDEPRPVANEDEREPDSQSREPAGSERPGEAQDGELEAIPAPLPRLLPPANRFDAEDPFRDEVEPDASWPASQGAVWVEEESDHPPIRATVR
jgi:Tfp pilus assembly protein PilF